MENSIRAILKFCWNYDRSHEFWSDVGVGGFCFVFVTLSPGCILNVAKFLSTVKFVVLSWGSLVIAVLCSLSAVAAAE